MAADRILSLQVLRFVAATAVIALHATGDASGHPASGIIGCYGPFGVDLFFVLSGLIIAMVSRGRSPGEFLFARLTRILPLYWLLTLVQMLVLVAVGLLRVAPLAPSVFLYPSWIDPYLKVGWTLRFELLFYLATALVLFRREALVAIIIGYLAAWAGRIVAPKSAMLDVLGSPLILEFAAGVIIARLPRSRAAALAASLAAVVWLYLLGRSPEVLTHLSRGFFYGVPAALIVYAAFQLRLSGPVAQRLAYLGDASYAAYLVHLIPFMVFLPLMLRAPLMLVEPLAIVGAWLLAVLLHEAVEKPLLARVRSLRPHVRSSGGTQPVSSPAS